MIFSASPDHQHLDIEVNTDTDESFKAGAARVVGEIRPDWKELGFKVFTDGITNKLVGVYELSKNDNNKYNDMVLVRGYGYNSELLIDRQAEIKNMKLLYENGCGAKLYASFKNGLAYEFVPGTTVTQEMVISPKIFPLVAQAMKRMHEIEIKDGANDACLWRVLRKFHRNSPDGFPENPEKDAIYKRRVFSKVQILNEIEKMESVLKPDADVHGKVAFCHNDVLLDNVVINDRNLAFIDYEYGDLNYREFDIANHFCEFVGVCDDNKELNYDKYYPSTEFQLDWIRSYLDQQGSQDDAIALQKLVDRFSPIPHLFWGIWALVQAKNSIIDFNFLGYAIQRFDEYKKRAHLAAGNS